MVEEEKKAAAAPAQPDAVAAKPAAEKKEEKQVGKFTHGDHSIHILLQKGKKFIPDCKDDKVVHLIVEIQVGNQKQYSLPKDDVMTDSDSAVMFDEHMFFELKNLEPNKAKNTNVVMRVFNRGYIKNELIGQAIFDLSSLYFCKNHKVEHTWAALENPDAEDFECMKGLMKISANVIGPNDNAQKLEIDSGPEPSQMKMFMSSNIKRTFNQLTMSVVEARDLPEFGMFSQSLESYFKVHYGGGNPIKTTVVDQVDKKIAVNQSILLPVSTPVLADRLVVEVFDKNVFPQPDTKIGALILSAKQLIEKGKEPGGFFIWRSLYGSPAKNDNDAAEEMNENPEIASDWKGMVLLHIQAVENDKPKKGVETMQPEIRKNAVDLGFFEMENYQLVVEVGQGIALPKKDQDYRVQVSVFNNDWKSQKPKEKKGEYVRWNDRSNMNPFLVWKFPKNAFSVFTGQTQKELGANRHEFRVYVYLLDTDDTPICFWHGMLSEFISKNAQWKWIQLKPDRSYGEVENDHEAGLVSIKMTVNRLEQGRGATDFKKELAWKKGPPRRIGAYNLRCYIFQARDLPAADSDGSSDPFIKIFNTTGEDVTTEVVEDNVNPIFMEVKEVGIDFQDYETFQDAPPVIFDVMDADEGLWESADFLGRCTIFFTSLGEEDLSRDERIPIPKWYDIKFGTDENSPACGQILCSFSLVAADMILPPVEAVDRHMDTMVQKLDYDVFINCLGLRQLESIGLMPIQKAFVKFMVKSLTDPKKSGQLENVKTNPGPSGSNPNINSVVKFNIPLPTAELYCPTLSCTVYDQVFLGLSQPQVGVFGIPLGRIMQDCNKKNANILEWASKFVEQLERAERGETFENPIDPADQKAFDQQDDASERPTVAEDVQIQIEEANNNQSKLLEDPLAEVEDDSMLLPSKDDKKNEPALLGPNGEEIKKSAPGKTKMNKKKDTTESKRQQAQLQNAIKLSSKATRIKAAEAALKTVDTSHNVSIPNYIYDKQLRVYREVMAPKNEIFKKVGYNDQALVKEIMGLMNQIPQSAANSAKVQRKNSMLSTKIARQSKQEQAAAGPEDGAGQANEAAAAELMEKIYQKTNLHYRRFFEDELENNDQIFKKDGAFYSYDITRGQSRGVKKSWFSFGGGDEDESGEATTVKVVGKFKGSIEIVNNELKAEFESQREALLTKIFETLSRMYESKTGTKKHFSLDCVETSEDKAELEEDLSKMGLRQMPSLISFMEELAFTGMIKQLLTKKTEAIVHLYLIQGYEFASRDIGSPSDPYLIVRCGESEVNDCENYQNDEPNPKFMKRLDFTVDFPGAPPLEIEAYDYDLLFGDDLIGKTSIDLDDRFFNPKWQAMDEKPIETRELKHMSSKMNQGVIDMWVDIDPANKTSDVGKVWDIQREPENQFEVRLAVFKCTNVPNEDWEGTTDAYIKCFISDKDKQETDTHYRCTTGNPSFNYRLLFGVTTPTIKPFILTMQCWDRDLLKSNDLICQWELNITEMVRDSKITTGPINLTKKYYEESLRKRIIKEGDSEPLAFVTKERDGNPDSTIVLEATVPNHKGPVKIYLDLRVVPTAYAQTNRVGAAREEPNVDPNLPPPIGRFKLSLNPISMLNQLCGAALRRKIWCCICCVFCLLVCYFVFPLLASFITIFGG